MELLCAVLLFLPLLLPGVMANTCRSDKDKENRNRVSCGGMSLSSVPATIDPGTMILNLTQNLFTSLNWGAYTGFPSLHTLELSQNRIAILEGSGTVLGELAVLHLSNNLLVEVGERAFASAPKLLEVYLRGNHLRSLHPSSFSGLPVLEILDLSRNRLTTLPAELLTQISSTALKTLDLEDNQIKLMPHNWFESKPDLPYVFLSKNPWLCLCDIGYLQVYLEDQEINVYVHTNPDSPNPLLDIENIPESVVCDHPPSLAKRVIRDLKEEEYCNKDLLSEPPPRAFGDLDIHQERIATTATAQMTTAVEEMTTAVKEITTKFDQITTTVDQMTTRVDQMTTTFSTTTAPVTTPMAAQHVITTPFAVLASTLQGRIMMWTLRWLESWTARHTWTESWTSRHEESFTWSSVSNWSDWSLFQLTTPNWPSKLPPDPITTSVVSTTTTAATTTTGSTSTSPSTPTSTTTSSSTPATPSRPTTLPPGEIFAGSHGERAGARVWCTWLFAGLLLLCLLSALGSCLLGLGLAWAYLNLYRPLARRVAKSADASAHIRLLDYHTKTDLDGAGGYGAALTPVDASGGVQATFRSVLFIAKKSEGEEVEEKEEEKKTEGEEQRGDGEEKKRRGEEEKNGEAVTGGAKLGITDVGAGLAVAKRRNQEVTEANGTENKEVFRKTLYRVFSCEEEIEGWRQVEEHWEEKRGMKDEGGEKDRRKRVSVIGGTEKKTRYSLILREEKAEEDSRAQERGGMEWLVGEWEMGGIGGRMNEGDWASLFSGMREDGRPLEDPSSVELV
ncbi:hypothetical protein ACEWY4_025155 [Coilia grayii]|uniref:LRRCT domain-containing protein n=1 Tax=Coilia grayii TaxID=363190 RepID=A0ABD1IYI8_9TELE